MGKSACGFRDGELGLEAPDKYRVDRGGGYGDVCWCEEGHEHARRARNSANECCVWEETRK